MIGQYAADLVDDFDDHHVGGFFLDQELRRGGHLLEVLAQRGAFACRGGRGLDLRLDFGDGAVLLHDRDRDSRHQQGGQQRGEREVQVPDIESPAATFLLRQQVDGLQVRVVTPAAGDHVGPYAQRRGPVDECVHRVPRRVDEVHVDLLAGAVAPDDRVVVVDLGGFERGVQVHLEAEHFTEIFLGSGGQADSFGQYLVIGYQENRLLHLARDIGIFGVTGVE